MSKKQENYNICWVSGNFHQRSKIINKVKELLTAQGEIEIETYGEDDTFEYVKSQIAQCSCFDIQRLVIINDWPAHKGTNQTMYTHFLKMCERADDSIVIICNNLRTESKKFLEALSKFAKVYEYETDITQWKAASWICGELAGREKEISESDASVIVKSLKAKDNGYTYDLDKLYVACDKICDYIGKKSKVTTEDVMAVFTDSPDFIIWSIYTLLDQRDFIGAMKLFSQGMSLAKDVKSFAESILYSFIWRYKLLFVAKEGNAQGWSVEQASREIGNLHKLTKTGTSYNIKYSLGAEKGATKSIYSQKMITSVFENNRGKPAVLCYSRKELYEIVEAIEKTLQSIRNYASECEIVVLMDNLLMSICNVGDQQELKNFREFDYSNLISL